MNFTKWLRTCPFSSLNHPNSVFRIWTRIGFCCKRSSIHLKLTTILQPKIDFFGVAFNHQYGAKFYFYSYHKTFLLAPELHPGSVCFVIYQILNFAKIVKFHFSDFSQSSFRYQVLLFSKKILKKFFAFIRVGNAIFRNLSFELNIFNDLKWISE